MGIQNQNRIEEEGRYKKTERRDQSKDIGRYAAVNRNER
jgi:hypothetical protein